MPDQVTRAEFAQRIKAQYPVYASVPDDQLVTKMLEKYPVYRSQIRDAAPTLPENARWNGPAPSTIHERPAPPNSILSNPDVVSAHDGLRSSLARVVYGGGDLLRRVTGMERVYDRPDVQAAMTPPENGIGRAASMVGDAAQFAVPLSRVATATRALSLPARAAVDAAASAGVAGIQSAGDPTAMTVAAAGGAVLPFAGAAARGVGRATQRAAAGARDGGFGGAIASTVRAVAPGEPRVLLTQALKPRSVKTNFPGALDRAIPEIKAAESVIGRPVANLDDLFEATKAAKQRLQQQLGILRGNTRGFQVDLTPVADAMEQAIPKKLQLESPDAALRLQAAARVYRRPFSIDEAETLLRETNAELDGFYAQYPRAQQSALTSNPGAAALHAQAKALRDAIYQTLDAPGQGTAARELNRRYGALLEVEGEAWRRMNVARRQQPESLSEQIGAVRAAADMARGTWRVLHGDLTGAADIAAAHAGRSAATAIKESQTTDALIRRAFEGYRGRPTPVPMPTQRPVRGALPRGPVVTPPPADRSGGRGVSAWGDVQYSGTPRQLQEGRTVRPMPGEVAPPPADGSTGRLVPAAPIEYAIDPTVKVKAGGVRVAQFSGDPAAAAAALVKPDVRAMLERMTADLDTFTPQRGRLVKDSLDVSDSHYAPGVAGSPVGDDIRVISEQNVGNADIRRAIRDLLAGKKPTNRLHTAALDAAMGYLERRSGYRGPAMPADWGAAPADDGFEAFSRAVDDITGER